MFRVLVADKMSNKVESILSERKDLVSYDIKTGLSEDEIVSIIDGYDGVLVRSATKITAKILDHASRLKIIGRAGIGVDNIDVSYATEKGVVVINSPHGNSITTAEHAFALIISLARRVPFAHTSMSAAKWEKSLFTGVELEKKTLGIIGCGQIGGLLAKKAIGFGLKVIGYDPMLSDERAESIGITKVSLDNLFASSDFISLHTPLVESTKNIINADALAKMKKTAFVVNCARGGLIDENALAESVKNGGIAGAAVDVFTKEPIDTNNSLLACTDKVILTPHLGGSTNEAQENVAIDVAEQFLEFFDSGKISSAVNAPSLSTLQASSTFPYGDLCYKVGRFASQISHSAISGIQISCRGKVENISLKFLQSRFVEGVLKATFENVNSINAIAKAKESNIDLSVKAEDSAKHSSCILKFSISTADGNSVNIEGSVFSGLDTILSVNGIKINFVMNDKSLYIKNLDKPGVVGHIGNVLEQNGINISNFYLGKSSEGSAIGVVQVESDISSDVISQIQKSNLIKEVTFISAD